MSGATGRADSSPCVEICLDGREFEELVALRMGGTVVEKMNVFSNVSDPWGFCGLSSTTVNLACKG